MPTFSPGDIVRAPFPYTDRDTLQHRPALVVSNGGIGLGARVYWVVMITSAENRPWPGDVSFGETFADAGLPAPSVVRPSKIAAVDGSRLELRGQASPDLSAAVYAEIGKMLHG